MSRHSVVRPDPSSNVYELHSTIDQMLRSGLLKVYELPMDHGGADARFNQLLNALAARSRDDSH